MKPYFSTQRTRVFFLSLLFLLSACATRSSTTSTSVAPTGPVVPAFPSLLPSPTTTLAPPTQTPIPIVHICTPLQGISLNQMSTLVANPYHPPAPGKDDPHAGVDLAIRLPNSDIATSGHPVQAAFAGTVVTAIHDRFPFGNALLVETPLDAYPAGWWQPAEIPTPAPTLPSRSALTCPPAPAPVFPNPNRRALYVLYAHMEQTPKLKNGDRVACGQVIGTVGSTGNALNPHLHFETRVGPAGLQMASMAHYHPSATLEEMSNYCLWTVSGWFQLVDPMKVLQLSQK